MMGLFASLYSFYECMRLHACVQLMMLPIDTVNLRAQSTIDLLAKLDMAQVCAQQYAPLTTTDGIAIDDKRSKEVDGSPVWSVWKFIECTQGMSYSFIVTFLCGSIVAGVMAGYK